MGSFAGGPDDMDEQIHRLNKDYNHLMDRYRRLKQLKKTPERDNEVDSLLKVSTTFGWAADVYFSFRILHLSGMPIFHGNRQFLLPKSLNGPCQIL